MLNFDEDFRLYCLELAIEAGASPTAAIGVAMAFEDFVLDDVEDEDDAETTDPFGKNWSLGL